MNKHFRHIILNCICIFFINSNLWSEENTSDENKINNGTYVYDPYEKINRSILKFNILVDDIAIQPVVTTYKAITPDLAEKGISNFFSNLKEPLKAITFLIKGDIKKSINSVGRFAANSSTSLGFYDTSKHLGLKKNDIDMGTVIGKTGIGSGPYLVIPIIGPTNMRDFTGRILDYYIDPISALNNNSSINISAASIMSTRAEYDYEINDLKKNSNDLYNSIKLLYHQRRMGGINEDYLRDLPVPQIYID